MNGRPPLSRPRWTQGYIPIASDESMTQLYKVGGYTVTDLRPNPCACCLGFVDALHCQYGKPCQRKVCAHKPNFIHDGRMQCGRY